jgi:hypothetical protein
MIKIVQKTKRVKTMSNELAYLLAPAADMDEIDQLLAEEEEQNQELVQI